MQVQEGDIISATTPLTMKVSRTFALSLPTMKFRRGEIVAVVGPNGSGKSSTLRLLAGLDAPNTGDVLLSESPSAPMVPLAARKNIYSVGFVSHAPGQWSYKLRERLIYDSALCGTPPKEVIPQVEFWLQRLDLQAQFDKTWKAMSAGYRMRCAIARQLICGPALLVLDEPIGPLDIAAQRVVLQQLREIASHPSLRVAIVVSSQHLHEIESIADTLLILRNGQTTWYGPRQGFGEQFTSALFEVGTSEPQRLVRLAQSLGYTVVHVDELGVQIQCPRSLSSADFLTSLVQGGIPIGHFRDLSQSSARVAMGQGAA